MVLTGITNSIVNLWSQLYSLIFYTWPFLLLIVLYGLKRRWKAYPLDAVILEKRGENLIKTNDRIGRKVEKATGMTFYQLLKSKDTIPVMNYDWVLHNKSQNTNFLEKIVNFLRGNSGTIFLFRYGSKQYKPIYINQKNPGVVKKLIPVKTKKGEKRYVYQYSQFDPRWVLGILDFDVIDWDNMNFMVQEQRASIERRKRKSERLMQMIIPITIIAASVVIGIFILKFSSDAGQGLSGRTPVESSGGGSKIMGSITNTFTPGE